MTMGFSNKLKSNFKQPIIINDIEVVFNNYIYSRCPNFSHNTYIMLLTTMGGGGGGGGER
jgi:hypothetical protein